MVAVSKSPELHRPAIRRSCSIPLLPLVSLQGASFHPGGIRIHSFGAYRAFCNVHLVLGSMSA